MLARYKNGCLQKIKRKDGTERWQFRWNALCPDGVIRERKKTLGLVSDYPQRSRKLQDLLAHHAVGDLRAHQPRERRQSPLFLGDVLDHDDHAQLLLLRVV